MAALTPLQAKVMVHQMKPGRRRAFYRSAFGHFRIADFDGTVSSDGHAAKPPAARFNRRQATVVQKGSQPEAAATEIFVTHESGETNGTLTEGDVTVGKAVAHLFGNLRLARNNHQCELKLDGQGMSVG